MYSQKLNEFYNEISGNANGSKSQLEDANAKSSVVRKSNEKRILKRKVLPEKLVSYLMMFSQMHYQIELPRFKLKFICFLQNVAKEKKKTKYAK